MSKDKFEYHRFEYHKKVVLVSQALGIAAGITRIAAVKWDRETREHVPVFIVAQLIIWPIRAMLTGALSGAVVGLLLVLEWLLKDWWKRKFGSK